VAVNPAPEQHVFFKIIWPRPKNPIQKIKINFFGGKSRAGSNENPK
jgi:hypothetical protein